MLCPALWWAVAHTDVGNIASVDLGWFKAHSLWFGSSCYPGAIWPKCGLVSLWAKVLGRVVRLSEKALYWRACPVSACQLPFPCCISKY